MANEKRKEKINRLFHYLQLKQKSAWNKEKEIEQCNTLKLLSFKSLITISNGKEPFPFAYACVFRKFSFPIPHQCYISPIRRICDTIVIKTPRLLTKVGLGENFRNWDKCMGRWPTFRSFRNHKVFFSFLVCDFLVSGHGILFCFVFSFDRECQNAESSF